MAHGVARRRVADREKNLVGFLLEDVRYAVEIRRVREIVRPLPVVVLPQAPPTIIGVADHRGEVIPVLDVRRRLGLAPAVVGQRTKWILVSVASRGVALVVDAVSDVFAASEQERREVPTTGAGDAARAISAVFGYRGSLVFVLDVDRVAAGTEDLELPPSSSERPGLPPRNIAPRSTPGRGFVAPLPPAVPAMPPTRGRR